MLQQLRAANDDLPVVIISGHGTVSTAVEATKAGAFDFIEKPPSSEKLLRLDPERARADAAVGREPDAAARGRSAPPDGRREPVAAPGLGRDQARGADQRDGAAARRERRRQGAGRAVDPSQQPAQPRAVHPGQLRGDSRGADRVGALRPREGVVHRRDREADRQVRAGRPRHDLPRRSRRHEREDAGQGAARAAGRRSRAARLGADDQGRRAGDRGDEQGSRGGDREGRRSARISTSG